MKRAKQLPQIVRSDLTRPSQWFVVTKYRLKRGTDLTTQQPKDYLVALEKFNVTDQMRRIIKAARVLRS